jgi:hypothetical protein|tara:strand:+ start:179 stop:616 length:438 start_codon:yes stop_codon:yes gene_type:complete
LFIGKNFVPDYRHWTKNYNQQKTFQDIDIHDVLHKTSHQSIHFTNNEIKKGNELLENKILNQKSNFVCFHSRTPYYYYQVRKLVNYRYDLRDFRNSFYAKICKYFSKNNTKTIVFGDGNNGILNKDVIFYNNNFKNDFLDTYLVS